jgi:carboxymethylenebutenolidase
VLPEVFGVNGWVRGVADRLAAEGYGALALPLFSRTAPALDLDYTPESLGEGRSHKERTRAPELLQDLDQAWRWLQGSLGTAGAPGDRIGCLGFCFGGHVALLAASLKGIAATCDFYGAGVASGRPGGGPPTLDEVAGVRGRLLCVCGTEDDLIPPRDVAALDQALTAANAGRQASGQRPHRLLLVPGGHGFLCEQRADFHRESAALAWSEMLAFFNETLG